MNNQEKQSTSKTARSNHKELSEPRIPPLNKKEARKVNKKIIDKLEWDKIVDLLINNPETKALFAFNVFSTLMRNPDLTMRLMMSFRHLSHKSSLPERDREILILRTAWLCSSDYEWSQHVLFGKKVGLTEEEINRIKDGPDALGWEAFDATLLRAVDELYLNSFIIDQTWKILNEGYNLEQIMDLIFIVGQYNMLAMFLNSFGVPLEYKKKGFQE